MWSSVFEFRRDLSVGMDDDENDFTLCTEQGKVAREGEIGMVKQVACCESAV